MGAPPGSWNDQLSIDTPELVALEFPLAGIGSRCLASLMDYLLQAIVFVAAIFLFAAIGSSGGASQSGTQHAGEVADKWVVAILILIPFLFQWGYFTLFEAFWSGRTPGKRLMKVRVIHQTGRGITFFESMIRNLIRAVDFLPSFYAVGVASLFITKRHQRLGDLAAGTLVVHEQKREASLWNGSGARSFTASMFDAGPMQRVVPGTGLPADAIARLTKGDLEAIDNFLARRLDLPLDVRARLAAKLVAQMKTRMRIDGPVPLSDETLLEGLERDARNGP
jgi:uncharacterized RDD family membrane protein YckC